MFPLRQRIVFFVHQNSLCFSNSIRCQKALIPSYKYFAVAKVHILSQILTFRTSKSLSTSLVIQC